MGLKAGFLEIYSQEPRQKSSPKAKKRISQHKIFVDKFTKQIILPTQERGLAAVIALNSQRIDKRKESFNRG